MRTFLSEDGIYIPTSGNVIYSVTRSILLTPVWWTEKILKGCGAHWKDRVWQHVKWNRSTGAYFIMFDSKNNLCHLFIMKLLVWGKKLTVIDKITVLYSENSYILYEVTMSLKGYLLFFGCSFFLLDLRFELSQKNPEIPAVF